MKCKECGTDYQGKFCPECRTQNLSVHPTDLKARKKKPFFLKWWFIMLVIVIAIATLSSCRKDQSPHQTCREGIYFRSDLYLCGD